MAIEIGIKRIYEPASAADGYRVLVDRLWPRGVTKADAKLDLWAKNHAPSHDLRKWFHATENAEREFATRYQSELIEGSKEARDFLISVDSTKITLLTATKDLESGHTSVLKNYLESLDLD